GTLVNVGGAEAYRRTSEGYNVIRSLTPCKKEKRVPPVPAAGPPALPDEKCDWRMDGRVVLADHRWYPTVATLADGRLIVVGGSKQSTGINIDNLNVPTYEFYPREAGGSSIHMPFLVDTMPFNLYPGLHLLPNGRLFVWANNKAMEFDYMTNTVAKVHPDIPGPPRSYPLTGSSVLLPLDPRNNYKTEVIVFGGSEGMFPPAWNSSKGADSFARIDLSSEAPEWEIETMPLPRVMPDGVILADGTVFISNGAARGVAGYNVSVRVKASNPVMVPVIYSPLRPPGKRFRKMARARVPRMYHSVSLLLPNGQVLVAGANPIDKPTEAPPSWLRWGTEFRVEAFSPPYLFSGRRRLEVVKAPARLAYGRRFWVTVRHVLRPRSGRRPPRLEAALVHTG
ncbi:MAG: glyoxal oxidase N-terminus-domain-containing protein, partial [Olpidium bornovanus]